MCARGHTWFKEHTSSRIAAVAAAAAAAVQRSSKNIALYAAGFLQVQRILFFFHLLII